MITGQGKQFPTRRILASSVNTVIEYIKRQEEKMPGTPMVHVSAETFLNLAKNIVIKRETLNSLRTDVPEWHPVEVLSAELMLSLFSDKLREQARKGELKFYSEELLDDATCEEILRQILQMNRNGISWSVLPKENDRLTDLRKMYQSYEELRGTWSAGNHFTKESLLEKAYQLLQADRQNQLMTQEEAASYERIEEGALSVAEEKLWNEIVRRSGRKQGVVHSLYEMESLSEFVHRPVIFSGYGMHNEVCFVTDEIIEKKMPAGKVTIYYSNPVYENFLAAELGRRGIPYRFTTGRSAATLPMVQLAKKLLRFFENDYFCEDFERIISCPVLRIKGAGDSYGSLTKIYSQMRYKKLLWGRRAFELILEQEDVKLKEEERQFIKRLLGIYAEEKNVAAIYGDLYRFISDYCTKGDKELSSERAVLKSVLASLELLKEKTGREAIQYLLMRLETLTRKENASSDAVSLCRIGAMVSYVEREYCFVIGLSAKLFMANTTESPVLTDAELLSCTQGKKQGDTVLAKEKDDVLKAALRNTFRTMKKEAKLYLGYSRFDTVESREQNPATFLRMAAEEIGVTLPDKSEAKGYAGLRMDKAEVLEDAVEDMEIVPFLLEASANGFSFSPTSMQTLMKCPAKYLYDKNLGIKKYDPVEKDPSVWLNPMERGELYHSVLQKYFVTMTENYQKPLAAEFCPELLEKVLKDCTQEWSDKKPVLSETAYQKTCSDIREHLKRYLVATHKEFLAEGWQIAGCEKKFKYSEIVPAGAGAAGIVFSGCVDRIDVRVREDGKKECRIIDYKSGKFKSVYDKMQEKQFIQDYVYLKAVTAEPIEEDELEEDEINEERAGEEIFDTLLPGDVEEYDFSTMYMRFEFLEEKEERRDIKRTLKDTADCYKQMCEKLGLVLFSGACVQRKEFFSRDNLEWSCFDCQFNALCNADQRMVK